MKKGDRIQDTKGRTGYVSKVGAKITMLLDGAMQQCAGPPACFKPSNAKHEPKAQAVTNASWKKGDRVKTKQNGEYVHGVIRRGGAGKVAMIMDGGEYEIAGPAHIFEASNEPLATANEPPSPMDKYEIKKYRPAPQVSEETLAFSAEIWCDGKPFLHAQNQGCGGCNMYHPLGHGNLVDSAERQIAADAEAWAKLNGMEGQAFEIVDSWVSWYTESRPHGCTAKQYWDRHNKTMAEFKRPES